MGARPATWRTLDLIAEASGFLASQNLDHPRLETERLLAAALGVRRIDLYLQFERILDAGQVEIFRGYVRQRLRGRPVQYIVGEAGFRLLDLEVTPAVLIPRPETELLVEEALKLVPPEGEGAVLDLCCGSGAVGIAMATEAATARVTGSDLSPEALAVARRNALRHDVGTRLHLLCGDLFAPLHPAARFDLILSNPPYIRSDEIDALQVEVRDHEPRLALDGGPDGLTLTRRIVARAAQHLRRTGHLLLEVGHTQAEQVAELMSESGFEPRICTDLAGIPRVVIGRRTGD